MAKDKHIIRIGTRGSPLALAQARWVEDALARQGFAADICPIRTTGDRIRSIPLPQMEGKGVFVKEIEEALLRSEVQLAVHSLKDLPTELPAGLCLASVPTRESPFDALILRRPLPDSAENPAEPLSLLPRGAKVGTSSLRRAAQLLHQRPDLEMLSLRGNLDTRLRKLQSGPLDAIVLAVAGLARLSEAFAAGFKQQNIQILPAEICTPAPGQGALGIEARCDDAFALQAALSLENPSARRCVEAERAFLSALGGGCRVPIGAMAEEKEDSLTLVGVICSIDGRNLVRRRIVGAAAEAKALGTRLAEEILAVGGKDIRQGLERELQGL